MTRRLYFSKPRRYLIDLFPADIGEIGGAATTQAQLQRAAQNIIRHERRDQFDFRPWKFRPERMEIIDTHPCEELRTRREIPASQIPANSFRPGAEAVRSILSEWPEPIRSDPPLQK
jgi:hypothetical protein